MSEIKVGLKHEVEIVVEKEDVAKVMGSGTVEVMATPKMIALMENAAYKAIDEYIGEDNVTVGTHMDAKHLAATPVGMKVRAIAEVIEVEGKKIVFKVEAYDEKDIIGKGKHTRFIVNEKKFTKAAYDKLND